MADSRLWLLLPRPLRELPADLAAVALLVIATDLAVLLPVVRETPLRVVVGLPFVLFLPGYAFVAALFPEAGPDLDEREGDDVGQPVDEGGIDGIERVALAFGLSIAVVPLIGLVLNFTPWGIRLVPIVASVSAFTLAAVAAAAHRRRMLPEAERFRVPYRAWLGAARAEFLEPETRADAVLNVLLVASILLAVSSVAYAVAVPKQGEAFTEFYLLTENESGQLVADDYPTEFTRGEPRPLVVGIGNHEHEAVRYSVVVLLQNVTFENNETIVREERRIGAFQTRVDDNETWHTTYNVTPRLTGTRLRLLFVLYEGDPPANPTVESAYRETHLWVNVTEPGGGSPRLRPRPSSPGRAASRAAAAAGD